MEKKKIRNPIQKRSIEKKQKIIEAGFQLFCEKGYYNTNTAEIAKYAGVSTGIVYNYFNDKKEIFLEAVEYYTKQITEPLYQVLFLLKDPQEIPSYLDVLMDSFVNSHNISKSAHEEMWAMSHSDPDVQEHFQKLERSIINELLTTMKRIGITPPFAKEKMYIIFNMFEDYCHNFVYHKEDDVDYEAMKQVVFRIAIGLLNDN